MRLYLAGPMTDLPQRNFPAFHAAAAQLRALGHDVVNPAELHPEQTGTWAECMRRDIPHLCTCQWIVLMPGWLDSRGARFEHFVAKQLEMRVSLLEEALLMVATSIGDAP